MKVPRELREETANSLEFAWPELLCPRDPWGGDDVLPEEASYRNYLDFGVGEGQTALDEDEWYRQDQAFMALYREVLDGRAPASALEAPARRLGLWAPARHDRRPLDPAPLYISEEALADHVEDWVPDVGLQAPDRVLGPWADSPLPARIRRAAGAALCFSKLVNPGVTPAHRIARGKPKPSAPYRAALRAIGDAPPCIWEVRPNGTLQPVLPITRHARPIGVVAGVPAAPAVVGRAVPGPQGWFLSAVLPLPGVPPRAGQIRRLQVELLRLRRVERRTSWEDVLRRRSELVYRNALSWAWLHLKDGEAPWGWPA